MQDKPHVCVVSLGGWCGVKAALRNLQLDGPSMPFDWMRSSIESVLHCLTTDFRDFLMWYRVIDSPYKDHATPYGHIYITGTHTFWHDNLEDLDDRVKFQRRIQRFRELGMHFARLLFVRAVNSTLELRQVKRLRSLLSSWFGSEKVWLLILVDAQNQHGLILFDDAPRVVVAAIEKLKCQTSDHYAVKYHQAIRLVLDFMQTAVPPEGHEIVASLDEFVLPRSSWLRHVSLGDDLTVPWCHDPVPPPAKVVKLASSDPLDKEIIAAQAREHQAFSETRGETTQVFPT